jgi:hypothetical protein
MICNTCQKDVNVYCWDINNKPICADCIRNQGYDGNHAEYCAACGQYLGQTSKQGKEMLVPAFYCHIESVMGKGIGTITVCEKCLPLIPDRMQYYRAKIQENIERFYQHKETH